MQIIQKWIEFLNQSFDVPDDFDNLANNKINQLFSGSDDDILLEPDVQII